MHYTKFLVITSTLQKIPIGRLRARVQMALMEAQRLNLGSSLQTFEVVGMASRPGW
jgi:hypothetical protein